MDRAEFLELTQEDVDLRSQVIGEELIDILEQLRWQVYPLLYWGFLFFYPNKDFSDKKNEPHPLGPVLISASPAHT